MSFVGTTWSRYLSLLKILRLVLYVHMSDFDADNCNRFDWTLSRFIYSVPQTHALTSSLHVDSWKSVVQRHERNKVIMAQPRMSSKIFISVHQRLIYTDDNDSE
jgi:hypothetical protein